MVLRALENTFKNESSVELVPVNISNSFSQVTNADPGKNNYLSTGRLCFLAGVRFCIVFYLN